MINYIFHIPIDQSFRYIICYYSPPLIYILPCQRVNRFNKLTQCKLVFCTIIPYYECWGMCAGTLSSCWMEF